MTSTIKHEVQVVASLEEAEALSASLRPSLRGDAENDTQFELAAWELLHEARELCELLARGLNHLGYCWPEYVKDRWARVFPEKEGEE